MNTGSPVSESPDRLLQLTEDPFFCEFVPDFLRAEIRSGFYKACRVEYPGTIWLFYHPDRA